MSGRRCGENPAQSVLLRLDPARMVGQFSGTADWPVTWAGIRRVRPHRRRTADGRHMTAPTTMSARESMLEHYQRVRGDTEALRAPLAIEDFGLQTMPEVSPAKWHIAHTSWFFETFVLMRFAGDYRVFHPRSITCSTLTTSPMAGFERPRRGLLSRPTVAEAYAYRRAVDDAMQALIGQAGEAAWRQIEPLVVLGLNHEQQHQELLLTDIKHAFAQNPLRPAYRSDLAGPPQATVADVGWVPLPAACISSVPGIGVCLRQRAAAAPRVVWRTSRWPIARSAMPTTWRSSTTVDTVNRDGGCPEGWTQAEAASWQAPLYWERREGEWWYMTLGGMRPRPGSTGVPCQPVRGRRPAAWAGRRPPTEAEWEVVADTQANR